MNKTENKHIAIWSLRMHFKVDTFLECLGVDYSVGVQPDNPTITNTIRHKVTGQKKITSRATLQSVSKCSHIFAFPEISCIKHYLSAK